MQTVYHNADEKVLIQSDKDTDGKDDLSSSRWKRCEWSTVS